MGIDLDAYREQSRATWDRMAPGWEDRREWFMEITGRVNAWLADALGPQGGKTVLELAAGTGDLGFLVAERAGGGARVISTDFSPEMVDVARRNGEARGATDVEYRVLDAERMDLEDDSVDAVACRWGYMLMADPAAALGETRRVLRAGGPLAFAVWSTPDRNPWATLPAMTLIQRGHMPAPAPGAPGLFSMGDEARPARARDGRRVRRPRDRGDHVRLRVRRLRRRLGHVDPPGGPVRPGDRLAARRRAGGHPCGDRAGPGGPTGRGRLLPRARLDLGRAGALS
jgi:SAM-dependent methyltransferase